MRKTRVRTIKRRLQAAHPDRPVERGELRAAKRADAARRAGRPFGTNRRGAVAYWPTGLERLAMRQVRARQHRLERDRARFAQGHGQ